jgi:hypothetical protein
MAPKSWFLPKLTLGRAIKLLPAVQITFLHYKAFTPAQREVLGLQPETEQSSNSREVVAEYDNSTKTIFLSDTWKGETAAELSVLVHEMVHHLQRRRGRPE